MNFRLFDILLVCNAFIPITVFYDLESKKILPDSLPSELKEEYKDITLSV